MGAGTDEALDAWLAELPRERAERVRQAIAAQVETAVAEVQRRLDLAQEAAEIGAYEVCIATGRASGSRRAREIFGFAPDQNAIDFREWLAMIHPDDRERMAGWFNLAKRRSVQDNRMDYRIVLNGEVRWIRSCDRIDYDANGRAVSAYGMTQDITEQKLHEEALWRAANEDALTGLANRKRFREQLDAMLAAERRVGLLMLDLDRLKQANDDHGHAAGDHLIRQAAERIAGWAPNGAVVGRLGGDEFAVATPCRDPAALTIAGEQIAAALKAPVRFGPAMLDCGGSAGGALYPDHAAAPEALMQAADVALLVTKLCGRGRCRLFQPGDETELQRLTRQRVPGARLAA